MGRVGRGIAAVLATALAAGAAQADALGDCRQGTDAKARLSGCSAVIDDPAAGVADKAMAYRNRGAVRLAAGATSEAMADLTRAIALAPRDERAFVSRAELYVRLGNTGRAIDDFGAALAINPGSLQALNGRGYAELVSGNSVGAIADFSRVIALNPLSAVALNNRGLAYRRAGDVERAINDYTSAITLNPVYALAYENRGHAREARNEKPLAIADFRRALLIDPSLAGARSGLARFGEPSPASEALVRQGQALVEQHCSRCHATGRAGDSPNPRSPPFHSLHGRHPILALREPLSRSIAAPHDEMPQFAFSEVAVDQILAYINSLGGGR